MAKERPLSIPVILGIKGKGLDEAIKDTKRLSTQLGRLSDTAVKAAAGFAAFKGGQLVANFARNAIDAGRDLQVNLNGLQSVFGEFTPTIIEFTKSTAGIGLSMSEAAKASTFLGSVLKQSGFSMGEVSEQTQRLVGLAADLSLTFGYDVQESLLAMTALFRGEYDPIEKFGVAMKQNEIEGVKLARGLEGLTGSAERLVDQQIRLELLYERSADSMGAYERQAGTLRVAQDTLRASFNNMQQILGTAMLPVVADLTASLIPLVETIGPVLAAAMRQVVPVLVAFSQNSEGIIRTMVTLIKIVAQVVTVIATLTKFVINNIEVFSLLAKIVAVVGSTLYALRVSIAVVGAIQSAFVALNITLGLTATGLGFVRKAMLRLPAIGIALGVLGLVTDFFGLGTAAEETGQKIEDMFDEEALLADIEALKNLNAEGMNLEETFDDVADAGAEATDAVGDFFSKLFDEVEKQQAKMDLESFGASPALINSILGSGEQWREVFDAVVADGLASVQAVQELFAATTTGYEEAMAEWENNVLEPFKEFQREAEAARDSFVEFLSEFEVLPSIESKLGAFETNAVNFLTSIEEKLADAFDNGQLLQSSYDNLLAYARDELNVLRDIERQRDQLLARRNAALQLIDTVNRSIVQAGDITSILRGVQDETEKIDVVEFARHTLEAGGDLREFKTALISNFIDPIEEAKSKSDKLVDGFRGVVARTREYVENLKALRALGLDPMLFNQLVEAGVEAGGETAQALIDGGADTINEVNSLFGELNDLGAELGEQTAQVMYGQGALFVDGIIQGLDDQLAELEGTADSLASSFTETFEDVLVQGIKDAIAAAKAELANMPTLPGAPALVQPSPGGGGGGSSAPSGPPMGEGVKPPMKPGPGSVLFPGTPVFRPDPTTLPGYRPPGFQYPSNNPSYEIPTFGSNTYVNVYSSSSPRAIANSLTRFNSTNPTQTQSSTNLRSLKSGG